MVSAKIYAEFDCDIKYVWQAVTSLTDYSWRSDIKKIVVNKDKKLFEEHTKDGFVTKFKITKLKPYDCYELDMENNNLSGHWTGRFEFCNNKTFVEFTEEASAKKFYMKPLLKAYLKSQQKIYISDLKKKLSKYSHSRSKNRV